MHRRLLHNYPTSKMQPTNKSLYHRLERVKSQETYTAPQCSILLSPKPISKYLRKCEQLRSLVKKLGSLEKARIPRRSRVQQGMNPQSYAAKYRRLIHFPNSKQSAQETTNNQPIPGSTRGLPLGSETDQKRGGEHTRNSTNLKDGDMRQAVGEQQLRKSQSASHIRKLSQFEEMVKQTSAKRIKKEYRYNLPSEFAGPRTENRSRLLTKNTCEAGMGAEGRAGEAAFVS